MCFADWHSFIARLHAGLYVQVRHRASVAADQSNGLVGSVAGSQSQPGQQRIRRPVCPVVGLTQMPATLIFASSDPGRNFVLRPNANESAC
jgi:hypothetical protein